MIDLDLQYHELTFNSYYYNQTNGGDGSAKVLEVADRVKQFATLIAKVPGLIFKEEDFLITSKKSGAARAFVRMEDSEEPVIYVYNSFSNADYSYLNGDLTLGFSLLNYNLDYINSPFFQYNIDNPYGIIWQKPNDNSRPTTWKLYYTTAINGVTLFSITTNKVSSTSHDQGTPSANAIPLDMFITTVHRDGATESSSKTVFRAFNNQIGIAGMPIRAYLPNTSTTYMPTYLSKPNQYYYLPQLYVYRQNIIIDNINTFSGLEYTTKNHQIFEADGITRMAIGEHNNNDSWQCYVNL